MGDADSTSVTIGQVSREKGLCDGCTFQECLQGTLGMFASLFLFVGGIATVLSFTSICWAVGLYMIVCAIVVGMIESPVLFKWNQVMIGLVNRVQHMKKYHYGRGGLYVMLSIFMFFCPAFSTIINALIMIGMGAYAIKVGMKEARAQEVAKAAGVAEDDDMVDDPFENSEMTDEDEARQSFSLNGMMESLTSAVGAAVVANTVSSMFGAGDSAEGTNGASSAPTSPAPAPAPAARAPSPSAAMTGSLPDTNGNPFDDGNPFTIDDDENPFGEPSSRV